MIISTDAQKAFEKLQHSFMIKILKKLGIDELYIYLIKTIWDTFVPKILLNG
jgi:hypothetical protein